MVLNRLKYVRNPYRQYMRHLYHYMRHLYHFKKFTFYDFLAFLYFGILDYAAETKRARHRMLWQCHTAIVILVRALSGVNCL